MEDVGQRAQTFSYEMSKFGGSTVWHGDHIIMLYCILESYYESRS